MKENVFNVLVYLFDNYLDDNMENPANSNKVRAELAQAGVEPVIVDHAFECLDSLIQKADATSNVTPALRIFTSKEAVKLDLECRDFLLFLERNGILNPATRESIIDSTMAMENKTLSLEELKLIVLIILFNQLGDARLAKIEKVIYEPTSALVH